MLLPLLKEGKVLVICGFLGRNESGKTTTLGRGGSDITAMLLANYLEADELVFVKDVDGIFSADPGKVRDPRHIESMDAEEAYILSSGGAKILHSKSLKYKPEKLQVRLVSLGESLTQGGTIINGAVPDLKISLHETPIHMLTIIGNLISDPDTIIRIHDVVKGSGGKLISSTLKDKATILYFEGDPAKTLQGVHEAVRSSKHLKALSQYEDLAMITVSGAGLETTPGLLGRITEPSAREGINIYGLLTAASSISILIDRRHGEKMLSMIKEDLGQSQAQPIDNPSKPPRGEGRDR
jgi:aspartate kinase